MNRKPSEFAVNSVAKIISVTQLDNLDLIESSNAFNESRPCHIYMICKRPRIRFVKDQFKDHGEFLNLGFKIQNQDDYDELEIEIANPFKGSKVEVESEYPNSTFFFKTEHGSFESKTAPFLQSASIDAFPRDFLDLEVLYVGQSYGVNGARTAPERLKKHETLQAIYSESLNKNPDQEIWLVLFSFDQKGIMILDGRRDFTSSERDIDKPRATNFLNKIYDGGIQEQQFINFTEAALIRYFKPAYNKDYIKTFPNPAHKTYKQCYELDVNSVIVEIDTLSSVGIKLYSKQVEKQDIHFAEFNMHNEKERKSMFDFSDI